MECYLQRLQSHQIPLLYTWLKQPDLTTIFGDPEEWITEIKDNNEQASWVHYYLFHSPQPIGFCQYYDTQAAPEGIWSGEPPGTVGIDYFIAEKTARSRGLGTQLLHLLLVEIQKEPEIKFVISDPHPTNLVSIGLLKKFGFWKKEHSELYQFVL